MPRKPAREHNINQMVKGYILVKLVPGPEDWIDAPTGFKVPKAIRVVDDIYLHPEKLYLRAEFEEKQRALNKIRYEAVAKIGSALHPGIRKVFGRV